VLVRNSQTIVIGGLLEDRLRKTTAGVPWLMDIPLFGWLFRWERSQVEKQNLLIFLTPTIIREDQDIQKVYQEKRRRMLEYKKRYKILDRYQDVNPLERKQPQAIPVEPPPSDTPVSGMDTTPREGSVVQDNPPGQQEKAWSEGDSSPYTVTIKGAQSVDSPAPADADATPSPP
jgi:general secretion pathway protein D